MEKYVATSGIKKNLEVEVNTRQELKAEYDSVKKRREKDDKYVASEAFVNLSYIEKALRSAKADILKEYEYLLCDLVCLSSQMDVLAGNFDFGTALKFLKAGAAVRRACWDKDELFIVKQVPCHIVKDIINRMQSLPQIAKDILLSKDNPHIDYTNQLLIVDKNGSADSWSPSVSDVFANDWKIVFSYNK